MSENTPIVEGRGIVKRYGHVTAIDHSDFELRRGEILAVIGDNGATLTFRHSFNLENSRKRMNTSAAQNVAAQ